MKNFKALLLWVGILMLLNACNGANQNQRDMVADKVTLTIIVSGNKAAVGEDFEIDILPRMVHERFPNITMNVLKLPDDQYYTTIKTKLAAGEGPDIFRVFPKIGWSGVVELSNAGFLADLSDLSFISQIDPGAVKDMSNKGKVYGISQGIDVLGTYYNKSLFEQVGIKDEPRDWEGFLETCRRLKAAGITPIVMGDKDSWWTQFGIYQLAANTVYAEDREFDTRLLAGEDSFTDPMWVKAITMYKKLYDEGYIIHNSLGLSGIQATQMFIDGKAAMVFDGTWDYPVLSARGAVDFERGFFPLPGNEKSKPVWQVISTASGWGVNASSRNMEAVNQVLNYWFDQESELFKTWVEFNPSISAFEGVELKNRIFKESYERYQSGEKTIYFPNQVWPGGITEILTMKLSEIIGQQGTTPMDVAEAMQKKLVEISGVNDTPQGFVR